VTDEAEWEGLGFEAALERLEQMVGHLESGRLGLDQALARYQLGVQLLGHCYRLLEGAERSVALITGLDAEGNPQTVPFDATATADRESPPERAPKVTLAEPDDDVDEDIDEEDIDEEDIDDDETPRFSGPGLLCIAKLFSVPDGQPGSNCPQ